MQQCVFVVLLFCCLKLGSGQLQGGVNSLQYLVPGFQSVRWDEARRICSEKFNGNLVVINSEPENVEVYNFAQCLMGEGKVWIGITDLLQEGIYRKDTQELPVAGFAKWFQDQPSDQEGIQNCVELGVGWSTSFNQYWNDEICSAKNKFVCQTQTPPKTDIQIDFQLPGHECWSARSKVQRQLQLVFEKKTWQDAENYCQSNFGGHLVSVKNQIDNQIIYWTVQQQLKLQNLDEKLKVWIGANDIEKEGDFHWADGQKVKKDFWAKIQPDNIQYVDGVEEDCVELFVGNSIILGLGVDGLWVDSRCDLLRPFVCEF
eukprot:TRINITY_DN6467_c0_g2_i2.p1 TRINITY_DN6467_c0_g2~~TRINITY_DN6467_c0_g2_i2.p1  ORF type:complete len:316 (+),score=54.17 TRINITY_DN6467_c0_g2_i2:101-1048(+)